MSQSVRKTKLFLPKESIEQSFAGLKETALRVKRERDILFQACTDVVDWYENSGVTDPVDSVTAWRICRKALIEVRKPGFVPKAEKS